MTFSQRMGILEANVLLQRDSMNDELRNSLWNVLDVAIWSTDGFMYDLYGSPGILIFSKALWFNFYKLPADERPKRADQILSEIKKNFFSASWNEIYDFLEFVLSISRKDHFPRLRQQLNVILERERSAYRLIEDQFVPITDEYEIQEIVQSIAESPFSGAREHLKQALDHLSSREKPDFRNSIKESISAVESVAREITGNSKATLGDALKEIEQSAEIHGALKAGFSALYGYTSDADGIRHAMVDVSSVKLEDAKYFLVTCAAFVNYIVAKQVSRE